MKLWKKLTSLILCTVLILSLFPAGILRADAEDAIVTYPVEGGNLYFDKSTGTITGCDSSVTSADIPAEIDGVPVICIGDSAFSICHNLINVTIPDSVTSIGQEAFSNCSSLTGIWVDAANRVYSSDAYGVLFDKDKTTLLQYPGGCPGKYTIPDSVTTVGDYAFADSYNLTNVTIPHSVTDIGDYAFYFCYDLTSVTIPDSVTSIGDCAFCCCIDLTGIWVDAANKVYSSDAHGVLFNKDKTTLIQCPGGYSGEYTIPNSVTGIVDRAFDYCHSLTGVTIPDSVTGIGDYTFYSCHSLTSVTISGSVTTIGYEAFYNCYSLTDVYYSGSEEQWNMITIGQFNTSLLSAMIHFNHTQGSTEPVENPFVDVKESDYFAIPVLWAVEKGITNGTSAGKFSPDRACTRGQIVTFLWRAAGSPEPKTTENPFSDVDATEYYYKAVLWAVENGITSGTGKGKFSPDKDCTRAQVATFLWRAQGEPAPISTETPFTDVEQGAYYYDAILWAVEQGITNGTGKGKFSPESSCTRGQIVTFLYRALG